MTEEPAPATPLSEPVPAAAGTAVPAARADPNPSGSEPISSGSEPGAGDGYAGRTAWKWRSALALVALVTAASYAWAINRDPLEGYYAAAVRSMSMSWHDFIYGAFDPAGTITLDKLPGAFWIQALSVRAFGLHTWAIVAPQAIEGVLTVLVLYQAVRRLAGPAAGLIAAIVFAVSPATVALNRGNISDTLMILLLVLAADSVSAAVASSRAAAAGAAGEAGGRPAGGRPAGGSQGRLILAAVWVGLAFQAKMIEAWLLLPALGLVYLIAAPGPALRHLRQVAVAAVVTGVVSLSWMAAVSLVPAAQRPYADGSHDNSVYQQVFVYNGFGRLGDQTPLQLLAHQSLGINLQGALPGQGPAPDRLLRGDLGRDTGWLLPAALAVAGWGLFIRRRQPRGDPLRACFVLWGAWLLTLTVTFSVTTTVNTYYTGALTPAVAAILGSGLAAAWSARRAASLRAGLAVVAAGTAGYAAWLLSTGTGVPGWLIPAVLAAGVAAVAAAVAALLARGRAGHSDPRGRAGHSDPRGRAGHSDRVLAAALGTGLLAGLLAPAAASAGIVAQHRGAFDTPYESGAEAAAIRLLFVQIPGQVRPLIPQLKKVQFGAPDLLAAQSSALASVFIYDSGLEALPLGGFTGTIPAPTLAQLKEDVREGQFHLAILSATRTRSPVLSWITAHCRATPGIDASLRTYFCLPQNAD
jgi:4-amino-4-deoxy-L-arabinose transferase-like glycosyltransferase